MAVLAACAGCGFEPGMLPSDALVSDAVTADAPVLLSGMIARWELDETTGAVASDSEAEPLDLTIEGTVSVAWSAGALDVRQAVQIRAQIAASKIVTRVADTRAFSIEAWLRPVNTSTNNGPARILTVSADGLDSSITLGQHYQVWVLRVRRVTSDDVGRPELLSPALAQAGTLTHVIATYDRGRRVFYVDGVEVVSDQVTDDLALDSNHRVAIASEPGIDQFGFRPWLGELHRIVVYERALDAGEAAAQHSRGLN